MVRETTVAEFVAESLEALAAQMPSGSSEAKIWRDAAKKYREHGSKKKVRVDDSETNVDFIRPDPASQS
jgi:hypothetical protein